MSDSSADLVPTALESDVIDDGSIKSGSDSWDDSSRNGDGRPVLGDDHTGDDRGRSELGDGNSEPDRRCNEVGDDHSCNGDGRTVLGDDHPSHGGDSTSPDSHHDPLTHPYTEVRGREVIRSRVEDFRFVLQVAV